jgi:DNA-directed RNA polymerase subunit RPC12/RpoP
MFIEIIAKLKNYRDKLLKKVEEVDKALDYMVGLEHSDETIREEKKVEMEKPSPAKKTGRVPYKKKAAISEEPKHIPGLRGTRKRASKYKGVSLCKPRKDGTHLWRAQYWENGKLISLGQFEIEELAAAAYAEHEGNQEEAARLRAIAGRQKPDMVEQAENNPDRAAKKVTIYICTHCKTEWQSKPDSCPHCKSATFNAQKVDADKV